MQGVVVLLVFVSVVIVVADVNRVLWSGSSRLLGHIRLLGRVNLTGALCHNWWLHIRLHLPRQDSKLLSYAGYFLLFLFIVNLCTCSGKLGYL